MSLPFRNVRQPKISELAFPDIYAQDSVTGGQTLAGTGSSSTVAQVLQSTLKEASDAVTLANKQLTDLQTVQQQLLSSTNLNTQALNTNTAVKGGSASSTLSTIGTIASGMFGQGSILSPIVRGIMSLFDGGSSTAQPTFSPF